MVQVIPILKVVAELIPIIGNIFSIFRRKKAEKKAKQLEKITQVVIEGVEAYANTTDKKDVKKVITNVAKATGVEDKLKELVKKYTK